MSRRRELLRPLPGLNPRHPQREVPDRWESTSLQGVRRPLPPLPAACELVILPRSSEQSVRPEAGSATRRGQSGPFAVSKGKWSRAGGTGNPHPELSGRLLQAGTGPLCRGCGKGRGGALSRVNRSCRLAHTLPPPSPCASHYPHDNSIFGVCIKLIQLLGPL